MGTGNGGSCEITTESNPYSDGVIRRKSQIRLGVVPPVPGGIKPRDGEHLVAKIGILLERGQSIQSWTLRVPSLGISVDPIETGSVTAELNKSLPLPWLQWFSHKWVGYVADFGEIVLGGVLASDMAITFKRSTAKRFQIVPMVFAFAQQPFDAHFLIGASILQAASDTTRFDTLVAGHS